MSRFDLLIYKVEIVISFLCMLAVFPCNHCKVPLPTAVQTVFQIAVLAIISQASNTAIDRAYLMKSTNSKGVFPHTQA